MLTTEQIINLARKQEWWNEFDKKRRFPVETLATYALKVKRYETFLSCAFLFDNLDWSTRAEQFAKLCKEKENKNSVPEYDLHFTKEVVAKFYTCSEDLTDDERNQIDTLLKAYHISYDSMEYNTKEKVLIVYKHSSSWARR